MQEDYVPSATLTAISGQLAAKIQAARDAQEIEGEEEVEIDEIEEAVDAFSEEEVDKEITFPKEETEE